MTAKQILINELETLTPNMIDEVYNYVSFIKLRQIQGKKIADITLASENSLAKDWLLPEEDLAWANL